jgi:hypothetical protein
MPLKDGACEVGGEANKGAKIFHLKERSVPAQVLHVGRRCGRGGIQNSVVAAAAAATYSVVPQVISPKISHIYKLTNTAKHTEKGKLTTLAQEMTRIICTMVL